MLKQILLVGLGGGLGSIMRYLTSVWLSRYEKATVVTFPLATFVVNILGCFLIGILIGYVGKNLGGTGAGAGASEAGSVLMTNLKYLLMIGFCGGYTTFSTFSLENMQLIQSGNYLVLSFYVLASVIAGLLCVWLGSRVF